MSRRLEHDQVERLRRAAALGALTSQPGRDIQVMGSAQLVRMLAAADLVDEYS